MIAAWMESLARLDKLKVAALHIFLSLGAVSPLLGNSHQSLGPKTFTSALITPLIK